MMKRTMVILLLGTFVFISSPAFARSMEGQSQGKQCLMMTDKGQGQCPIASKFMMKAHFLLEHKTDIGLTDDQVKSIKDLKLQMEKDGIRQCADMKTAMLDVESKLTEDKVDVEGTNALIDKGTAAASTAAKSNLAAYVQLKSLLTPDQLTKMKAIHEQMEMNEKEDK